MTSINQQKALKIAQNFTQNLNSVILSTCDNLANPFASYAPFVEDDNKNIYICISGFVKHSKNLSETKKANLLFIDDESKTKNIFARQRLYGDVTSEMFQKNDERNDKIYQLFEEKFAEKANFLRQMPDFRIYKLSFSEANLVLGFGATYSISGDFQKISAKTGFHEKNHEDNLKA